MTEHNPENDRQDPADQYKVDEAVQTEEQAPAAEPEAETEEDPEPAAPAAPVQVSPEVPSDVKTHTSSGVTYEVTPERGFRQVNEA